MNSTMHRLFETRSTRSENDQWLTISDLMAGLMMVFLFISIALMRDAFIERDRLTNIAKTYIDNQIAIGQALTDEFRDNLEEWDAVIDHDQLSFEFQSPEVLFKIGEVALQPRFVDILDDFFPRYLEVLKRLGNIVAEVRIEGHTSSDWAMDASEAEAYFNNMALSQGRTRSVLEYVYNLPDVIEDRAWMKSNIVAVGFSSSRIVFDIHGREDQDASRRVVFRIVTNAEAQILRISNE